MADRTTIGRNINRMANKNIVQYSPIVVDALSKNGSFSLDFGKRFKDYIFVVVHFFLSGKKNNG
jgi:hypothetical protein